MGGPLWYLIHQFDLNVESNFATWCSSMLLLLNALSAYGLARGRWATNRRTGLVSVILAAGFLLLSVDDFIGMHEFVEQVVARTIVQPAEQADTSIVALVSLGEQARGPSEFVAAANGVAQAAGQPSNQADIRAAALMLLGPLFGIGLASGLTLLMAGSYLPVARAENLPFLSASIGCVFLVGLSEVVYNQAGGGAYWHFRLEVLFEEGSELLALLLFLIFQSRELDALDRADFTQSSTLIAA